MQISLNIENEFDDDPETALEKNNKLLMKIYKEFPEALWEKSLTGFKIFL